MSLVSMDSILFFVIYCCHNIRCIKFQNLFLVPSCTCLFPIYRSQVLCWEWMTGSAPTTSHWSTISLPSSMQLILEVWLYISITYLDIWIRYLIPYPPYFHFSNRLLVPRRTNILPYLIDIAMTLWPGHNRIWHCVPNLCAMQYVKKWAHYIIQNCQDNHIPVFYQACWLAKVTWYG